MPRLLILLAVCAMAHAQEPKLDEAAQKELAKKPQYERMLKGEDAKKAQQLTQKVDQAILAHKLEEAKALAEELIAIRVALQGADHWEVTDIKHLHTRVQRLKTLTEDQREKAYQTNRLNREVFELWQKGDSRAALPIALEALRTRLALLGDDDSLTATSYLNVGAQYEALADFENAGVNYREALKIQRKVLGEEHPATAASYNNVASNLQSQGKAAEAQLLYQKALDISRRVFGEYHSQTATSYNNVAFILNDRGKVVEARPYFLKSLQIRQKLLGEVHRDTATSYNNLAANLNAQGKAADAQPLLEKALEIRRKVLGDDDQDTASSYNNTAVNLDAQGKHMEAQPLYQKALGIYRKLLGEDHPITAVSYTGVAFNLNSQGKIAEAQPLLEKALEIRLRTLGKEHPDTANSYSNLAVNLDAMGMATDARPLLLKALSIYFMSYGEDHPSTALAYHNLAFNLGSQGRNTEAQQLNQKSLEIRRRVLGEDHPDTAASYNALASSLNAQGKAAAAQPLVQNSLAIQRRVLGDDHPATSTTFINLAYTLHVLGKVDDAALILHQAIFSHEASRLNRAEGIERSLKTDADPRLLLAAIEQARSPAEALLHVEATLARGLLDQQAGGRSRLTPAEADELAKLQDRMADLQSQIGVLVSKPKREADEQTRMEELIRDRQAAGKRLAELAVAETQRALASREAIQDSIPGDAALLMWVDVTDNVGKVQEHFVCAVRRTGEPIWVRLPGSGPEGKWTKEDTELPGKLRAELARDGLSREVAALAMKLRAQRIEPVMKQLAGVKTLYVVGVNEMVGIPVELLAPEFTIGYVPSGTFLARRGKPMDRPASILAVGDPVYEIEKPRVSSELPGGGLLVQQIAPGTVAAQARLQPGDVLLKYSDVTLTTVEELGAAIQKHAEAKEVALKVWRIDAGKAREFEVKVAPGRLGVVLAREPAPKAIAARRQNDALLLALRGDNLKDLPGTRAEVARITAMIPDRKILLDGQANEQKIDELRQKGDLQRYRYLHFATHGAGNSVKAFESALILSQNRPRQEIPSAGSPFLDNQVSAREVLEFWKLDAELVTLSACETAIGKQAGGDGLLGFAQAFLLAGSRAVCLSLWKVDDTATALLMQRFYQNLLGKRDGVQPMKKIDALKEAKDWLRNLTTEQALAEGAKLTDGIVRSRGPIKVDEVDPSVPDRPKPGEKPYAHPKYWAAFILIGDPD